MTRTLAELDFELNNAKADIAGLKKKLAVTFKGYRETQSGLSNSMAAITNTLTGVAGSVTALTLWSVGISLVKIDEKGITLLGATREWPWKKKIDNLQKKIESQAQKIDRQKKEKRENLIDENETYIKNLKNLDQVYYKKSHATHLGERLDKAKRSADRANGEVEKLRKQLRSAAAKGKPNGSVPKDTKKNVNALRASVNALSEALAGV